VFKTLSPFQRVCVSISLAYVAGFVLLLGLHPGSPATFESIFDICEVIPHVFGGICCCLYARRGRHTSLLSRLGWLLIGLSCFSYLLGDLIWICYTTGKVPYPSWADLAWLSVFPLQLVGILLLFGSIPNTGRVRIMLDGAIAAGSVGVLSWYFLGADLWHRSGMTLLAKIVSVTYPLCDVAVLFGALVLSNSLDARRIRLNSYRLLAAGLVIWAAADTIYVYARFHNTFRVGDWFEAGWPFGALLIGYGALLAWWRQSEEQKGAVGEEMARQAVSAYRYWRLLAPYVAAGIALVTIFAMDYTHGRVVRNSTLLLSLGLVLLVMLRQVFILLENRHLLWHNGMLMEQLRTTNEELEQRVVARTQQIGALLELTQAVNNTLQVHEVLVAAASHARQAMRSHAALIWLSETAIERTEQPAIPIRVGFEADADAQTLLAAQDIRDEVEALPFITPGGRIGYCLRAPLRWQQHLLGMIGVVRWDDGIEPTEWETLRSIGLEVGTALENACQHLAALKAADQDPVTGLYNHRAIHQHLERELARAQQEGSDLSVFMMDLNNFKLFNDTYGHPVGDEVLRSVARVIQQLSECGEYAGRYGGDEFLMVLPRTDVRTALERAERLRGSLRLQGFRRPGEERTVPISLSIGVATFPTDSANRHELLTLADANLYAAKESESGISATSAAQHAHRQLRTEDSFNVLDTMLTAVDNKDSYTRRHSEDVTEYALWIAEELGASEETLRIIRIGGLLHDVGKIGVPAEILRKPGRLTDEEYEVLKRHPQLGALIVGSIPGMETIVDIVRSHHERWDGRGYPDGTAGEATPFLGRLVAVADAFSAMTTDRPYRKGMDWAVALGEIEKNISTQFDPICAQAFIRAAGKRHPKPLRSFPINESRIAA
jgi:diguanylate cyclase (GGDEF)-like protein/putative nucleotidyltransferase with HDIG domain